MYSQLFWWFMEKTKNLMWCWREYLQESDTVLESCPLSSETKRIYYRKRNMMKYLVKRLYFQVISKDCVVPLILKNIISWTLASLNTSFPFDVVQISRPSAVASSHSFEFEMKTPAMCFSFSERQSNKSSIWKLMRLQILAKHRKSLERGWEFAFLLLGL